VDSHDLGHGVRVVPLDDGGYEVLCVELHLPWTLRAGPHPGSTVLWQDAPYEVVGRTTGDDGDRWLLQPWLEGEAMRGVFRLDPEWVAWLGEAERTDRRSYRLWWWTLPLAPLLALAPAPLQRRWQARWGFSSERATMVSAVAEIALGWFCVMQLLTAILAGESVLPASLRGLAVVGPVLAAEGILRLKSVMSQSEPMGSLIGLPLMLFVRHGSPQTPMSLPVVHRLDEDEGVLELVSETVRSDWSPDGVLRYRDRSYRLCSTERLGTDWRYRFERIEDDPEIRSLRLAPPRPPPRTVTRARPPSMVRTALVTALACIAPRVYQERWARQLSVRSTWFTILGASAELLGGWVNLGRAEPAEAGLMLAVNLFFLVEAVTRFALMVMTGRPVGSLLGIPLRPLLERLIPPPTSDQ
jgi:hypothetical protein